MNFFKKSFVLLTTLLFTLSSVGCSKNQVSTSDETKLPKEINISYVKAPLNVPSIVEKNKQLFENEFSSDGIEINYPEITSGSKMTEAVAGGSLDFCNAIGATSVILAAANGVDIKIIGVYSRAPKAFTIMAKDPNIKSMKDLKGKKIVGPKGTILHQLLIGALVKEDLTIDDVEFINMDISSGVSALLSDNADAVLVAGSATDNLLENGAHVITTGEGILDATIVIAASGEFINTYPDIVKRYLKVHAESLEFMKENPEETFELTSTETELSLEQVENMYALYNFDPTISENDIKELEKTQDFLVENEMLTKTVDINSLIAEIK
ncbi:NrtA/SsuA/CpmA family ABC transporter substrate-binding protein [Clostridium grantii]|uniref:Sulfonate transport system substrate-binding protein n=1 Tax=Clostridium grantii DSM 8605 TaxID=1121316 RepID=A0A1M5X724_9CLOT|nr:NrtA/SsuA/CpmA family ABC transporter substrate-binding protein [Clostridium grantii]SHH95625.1 sulfonate transport system substrate-binding protein [Clostridium grantii DSM 8605]